MCERLDVLDWDATLLRQFREIVEFRLRVEDPAADQQSEGERGRRAERVGEQQRADERAGEAREPAEDGSRRVDAATSSGPSGSFMRRQLIAVVLAVELNV